MQSDQEGLLPDRGLKSHGLNWSNSHSNSGGNNNNILPNSLQFIGMRKNNILLIIISLVFTTCTLVYLYLNMQAIDGNTLERESAARTNNKPLSRRRPMLNDESIFSDSGPSMIRLSDLLAHCIVALKVAGRDVVKSSLNNQQKLDNIGSKGLTMEGADDIVTGADLRSHKTIQATIKDSFPRLRIVSEEDETKGYESVLQDHPLPIHRNEFTRLLQIELNEIQRLHVDWGSLIAQDETLVWIDPLDATKEYSENLTDYVTLMACVVHKSEPIAGIIYKPFKNLSYWSIKDQPTEQHHYSSDLSKILRERAHHLENEVPTRLRVIVSRSHAGDVKEVVQENYNGTVDVISSGGSGFKTVELLGGRADVYVHLTRIKKWDICAPNAILNSINGARFTDRNGQPIMFGNTQDKVVNDGIIASLDHNVHREMVEHLKIKTTTTTSS